MNAKGCAALADGGAPCRVAPLAGSEFCWNHEPGEEMDARREEARRAGGRNRGLQLARPVQAVALEDDPPEWWELKSPGEVRDAYGWCVRQLASGKLDARTANAIVGALHGLGEALRDGEDQQRLESLERAVGVFR